MPNLKTKVPNITIVTAAKPNLKPMTKVIPKPRLTVELQTLADLGVQRSYRKGAVILNDAEVGDAMYILIQGRVRSCRHQGSLERVRQGWRRHAPHASD